MRRQCMAAVLMLMTTLGVGCSDATGVASMASVLPARTQLGVTEWVANGLSATFENRSWYTIDVQGRGCDGRGASVDHWTNGTWSEVPFASPTLLCLPGPHENRVLAGDTLSVYAQGVPLDTGRYRLRLMTTAGEVVSGPVVVR